MFSQHKNDISKISKQISQLRKVKSRVVRDNFTSPPPASTSTTTAAAPIISTTSPDRQGEREIKEKEKEKDQEIISARSKPEEPTRRKSIDSAAARVATSAQPAAASAIVADIATAPTSNTTNNSGGSNNNYNSNSATSAAVSTSINAKSEEPTRRKSIDSTSVASKKIEQSIPIAQEEPKSQLLMDTESSQIMRAATVGATLHAAVAQGRAALVSSPYPVTFSDQLQDKDSRLFIKPTSYPFVLDIIVRLLINSLEENSKLKSMSKMDAGEVEFANYVKNVLQREGLGGGQLSTSAFETIFSNFNYYQIIQEQLLEITKLRASLEEESIKRISVENTLQALIEIQEAGERKASSLPANNISDKPESNASILADEPAIAAPAVSKSQAQNNQSDLESKEVISASTNTPIQNEVVENSTHSLVYSPDKTLTESVRSDSGKGPTIVQHESHLVEEQDKEYIPVDEDMYEPKEAEVPIDMLFLEIKISDGVFGTLPVHVNSDAKELAINFVNEHQLDSAYIEPLIHYIRNAQEQLVIQLVGALPNRYEESSVPEPEPEPEPEQEVVHYNSQPVPTSTVHTVSSEPDQYRYAKKPNRRRNIPPPPPEPMHQTRPPGNQADDEQTSYYVSPNISIATSPIPQTVTSVSPIASPQQTLMESGYTKSPQMGAKPISPILSSSLNKSVDRKDSNALSRSSGGRSTGDVSLNLDELDLSLSPPMPIGKVPVAIGVEHSNYYPDEMPPNASYSRHSSYHRYDDGHESSQIYDVSLSPQQISQHMHSQDLEQSQRYMHSNGLNQSAGSMQSYVSPPPPPPPGQKNEQPLLMGSSYLYNKAVEIFDRASSLINNGDIVGAVPLYEYSLVLFEQSNLSPSKLNVIRKEVGYWTSKAAEVSLDTSSNSLSNSGNKNRFAPKTEAGKHNQMENHRSPKDSNFQKPIQQQHTQPVYNKQQYNQPSAQNYNQGTNRRTSRENML